VEANDPFQLQRFVDAQRGVIDRAIAELSNGRKESHWMWFVFPQLAALGRSATAKHYGIGSLGEARAYLAHPVLGPGLTRSVEVLLPWAGKLSADEILGSIDAMKLRSCLTLFDAVEPGGLFARALSGFYDGAPDQATLALLNGGA
jgi:uncharacterized protein (DUF1810 family)